MVTMQTQLPSLAASDVAMALETALSVVRHSCVSIRAGTRGMPQTGLTEAEALDIEGASPERRAEFAAGRTLAREAMRAIGREAGSIRRGTAREPLWPSGVAGSISHSRNLCVAAVVMDSSIRSIGIDIELEADIEPALWTSICSASDLQRVERLTADSRAREVARIFSAKEAAFKCQFPLTRRWIEFNAVSVLMSDDGAYQVVESTYGVPPLPPMRGAVLLRGTASVALAVTEAAHSGPCAPPREPIVFSDIQA